MSVLDSPSGRLQTERPNPASVGLGEMRSGDVVSLMASQEYRVTQALNVAAEQLAEVADRVAECFQAGGRTILLGAGTSGRLALQEVAELPPTFGVPPEQFLAFVASKAPIGPSAIATTEDDTTAVVEALKGNGVGSTDVVIGLAASGRTPFVIAGLSAARSAGAWCCGIANNPGSELLTVGQAGILLDTGPEILTGSTRLNAGTSQKVALNRITTAAMVQAGRVTGNYMTELRGTNAKLRARAVGIVAELCSVPPEEAEFLLAEADWHVRTAVEHQLGNGF